MKTKIRTKFINLFVVLFVLTGNVLQGTAPVFAADATGVVASAATASDDAPAIGTQITVTVNIDMSGVTSTGDDALGSYTGSLAWNPLVLAYDSYSGAPPSGFTGVVNVGNVGTGAITFNGANASGATDNIVVLVVTFDVIGAGDAGLDLAFSAMAAAGSFSNLLPIVNATEDTVTVAGEPVGVVEIDGDAHSQTGAANASSVSFDHTTGTGNNRLVLVGVSWNAGSTTNRSISSVVFTYDTTETLDFSVVRTEKNSANERFAAIYRSTTEPPNNKSGTLTVTFNGDVTNGIVAGAANFKGVDQTTPLGTDNGAYGNSTAASVTLTGLNGNELVFDTLFQGASSSSQTVTAGDNQTRHWHEFVGNTRGAASTEQAASSSVTMSWTASSSSVWAIAAVSIRPALSTPPTCYALTLTKSGLSGSLPTTDLANSPGCPTGEYVEGQVIGLTANPDWGYEVEAWSGTDNDSSTELTNVLTMPAVARTVNVNYQSKPCYKLTLSSGDHGGDPTADPTSSQACTLGNGWYVEDEEIDLTAQPDSGFTVDAWSGTDDDSSKALTNTLTMSGAPGAVHVTYEEIPPQVTLDGAVSTNIADGVDTISVSHTTGSGENRLTLVTVYYMNYGTTTTIDSVTFTPDGGSAVDLGSAIAFAEGGAARSLAVFAYVNPPASTAGTITANFDVSIDYGIAIGAINFQGVDLSTPYDTPATANGESLAVTPIVLDVPTTGGNELVFDSVAIYSGSGAPTLTVDGSQTQQWNFSSDRIRAAAASVKEATGTTTTMSWTRSSTPTSYFAIAAIPINPAIAGPTQELTMAVTPEGGGTVTPAVGTYTYAQNAVVPITATPATGYTFNYWEPDDTPGDPIANPYEASTTVTMDADYTVTAHFAPITHTLDISIVGDGYVQATPGNIGFYNYGTEVELTAWPASGWLFDGWSGDLTGMVNPQTITMDANKTITATFIEMEPETVYLDGPVVHGVMESGSTLSMDTTTGSGENRLMLVGVSYNSSSTDPRPVIESVTFTPTGEDPLTLVLVRQEEATASGDGRIAAIYYLDPSLNPDPGTSGVLSVAFSGSFTTGAVAGVANFLGVDQENPLGTANGDALSSVSSIAVDVSTSGNELVFDTSWTGGQPSWTMSAVSPQTELWNDGYQNTMGGASTKDADIGTTTMSWTRSNSGYMALVAVPINPESGVTPSYTVTFLANGGSGTMAPQTASSPTALTTNAFERTGYAFTGWNTVSDGSGIDYADGADYDFSADIMLYAQWTETGTIIIEKQTIPDGHEQTFEFTGDVTGTIGDGGQIVVNDLVAGTYQVQEVVPLGWVLSSIVCDGFDSTPDLANNSVAIALEPGETGTCVFTNILYLDFGDAPDTYKTLLASDGARHFVDGPVLGYLVDDEWDGLPTALADGDDKDWVSDEDGVSFPTAAPLTIGANAQVGVVLSQPGGKLDAWIDFNGNGSFDHPSEHLWSGESQDFSSPPFQPPTTYFLDISVPADAIAGVTYARFRLSTAGGLQPFGYASDGEVEDYLVEIVAPTGHTVIFNGNGATSGTMTPQTASTPTALTLNSFSKTGYSFAGWNTVAAGGGTAYTDGETYDFSADITLYAQWTANTYTVTFDANGGSAPSFSSKQVTYDTAYETLATVGNPGYTFAGWFTAASGGTEVTAATIVTTASNHTLYAQWTANTYTLTVNLSPEGSGTVILDPAGGSYDADTTVTLTPNPASGYQFDEWSGDNASDIIDTAGVYTILMNGDKTVTANFAVSLCTTVNIPVEADTHMRSGSSRGSYNYGGSPLVRVNPYYQQGSTDGQLTGALLRWNLSGVTIPAEATLDGASITFNVTDGSNNAYSLFNMRRAWVEGTNNGAAGTGASWNYYGAGTGSWGTAGAQNTSSDRYDTNLWNATASDFNQTGSVTFDLNAAGLAVVSGWLGGTVDNYGVTIQNYSGLAVDIWEAASKENTTQAGPTLNVTYCIATTDPTILTSVSELEPFSTEPGTPSTVQSYTVSGVNLESDIDIGSIAGFVISTDESNWQEILTLNQSGGTVSETMIYVRMTGTDEGTFSGNIAHVSSGATQKDVAVTGTVALTPESVSVRVNQSSDDAEEALDDGSVDITSSDLELINDSGTGGPGDQIVGVRFQGVSVPAGAIVHRAYIEFETDATATSLAAATLTISGQADDNPVTFTEADDDISDRAKTTASATWIPDPWDTVDEKHQTSDIKTIVQEIVDRSGWSSGNAMAFLIEGDGTREAEAFDGEQAAAPLLVIEYFDSEEPTVTVTADSDQSKVYGESDPTFTYTYQPSDPPITFTGALSRVEGEDAGTYAITQGDLAATGYTINFVPADFTITAKPITVTADARTKVYGDDDPDLTYQYTPDPVGSDSFSGALTRAAGENVGTYAISQGTLTLGDNYNITFTGANLTITTRPITVTADDKIKNQGEVDPPLTYTITSGSLAFSDAFTGALARISGELVGTYAITRGNLALNANYNMTFIEGTLTISEIPTVTVTVHSDQTKVYGQPDPVFTYQSSDPGVEFTGALNREAGEDVDTYAITQGTLAADGYVINFVPADFTITAMPITVTADAQTKVYGDVDPDLTYQYTPALITGDSFSGALERADGENIGTSAISQGTLTLGDNYNITFTGANLTITTRPITVTADDKIKNQGTVDPPLTYTITSGSLAFTDAFTGALARVAGENIGDYAILQGSLALTTNYNMTFVEGTLTIIAGTEHEIDLEAGWNLVSFNLTPSDPDIEVVLEEIMDDVDLVYGWNGATGTWLRFDPAVGFGNTLEELDETMGFWINMDDAATLTVVGTEPTTTDISLYDGWNLMGYPSDSGDDLPGALSDITGKYNLVMAYHAADTSDPWKLYEPDVPDWVTDLDQLDPGWGYWIDMTEGATLSIDF